MVRRTSDAVSVLDISELKRLASWAQIVSVTSSNEKDTTQLSKTRCFFWTGEAARSWRSFWHGFGVERFLLHGKAIVVAHDHTGISQDVTRIAL